MKAKLGNKYRDRITGIEGVCTGIAEYLTGCTQLVLEHVNTVGSRIAEWYDIDRLEEIKAPRVMHRVRTAGGPPPSASPARPVAR